MHTQHRFSPLAFSLNTRRRGGLYLLLWTSPAAPNWNFSMSLGLYASRMLLYILNTHQRCNKYGKGAVTKTRLKSMVHDVQPHIAQRAVPTQREPSIDIHVHVHALCLSRSTALEKLPTWSFFLARSLKQLTSSTVSYKYSVLSHWF